MGENGMGNGGTSTAFSVGNAAIYVRNVHRIYPDMYDVLELMEVKA